MKKLFLVLGLSGFCATAFSQQGELFNAREHLQKKTNPDKKKGNNPIVRTLPSPLQKTGLLSKPILSHILPNGDRIYILPVDNMPCVSPDMTRYRSMPNADDDINRFILRQRKSR